MNWGSLGVSVHRGYMLTGGPMPHPPEGGEREVALPGRQNSVSRVSEE